VLRIAKHLQSRPRNVKYSLTIRWTVGHVGISDNEKVNREAKCTMDGHCSDSNCSDSKDLPKYVQKRIKHSMSALRQENNKDRNKAWKSEWHVSKEFKRL
jgi:hypothetical protein